MCLLTGLHGWRLRRRWGRYLSVSSHLTTRKVGDRLFYFKSLVLSSCIYFRVEDNEGSAVNCEKNLRKRQGRGAGGMLVRGGKTNLRWNSLIAAFRNGDLGEPSCNAIQPVTRRVYSFWRCDIFPWVQTKTWLNCCEGFPARRTWKLVISRFFSCMGQLRKVQVL